MHTLAAWTLSLIKLWTPAVASVPHVPYEELAQDVAGVVLEEGPIWLSPEMVVSRESEERRTSALLASLGYWEGGRFAAYVDSLECVEWSRQRPSVRSAEARRLLAFGDCMGGIGYSLWQVIPVTWQEGTRVEHFTPDRLWSRREAARAALLIARSSYRARGNLSGYTGEPEDTHPKADVREAFARRYWNR